MEWIIINQERFLEEIQKLEEKRDEHPITSAEYIEIDNEINTALRLVRVCAVKTTETQL